MDKLAINNNGVKFLLVAVDVFLGFSRVVPMRSKNAKAFEKMIESAIAKSFFRQAS